MSTTLNHPHVLVVVVNYRTPDFTIQCLESLRGELAALNQMTVVVTDNRSGDDSVPRITEYLGQAGFGNRVRLQPLDTNGGFAAGNNAAIQPALASSQPPDYVLLLNPDTIVHPGGVVELVRFLEAHPDVGIAGSRLEDPDGTPQRSAFRFPSAASDFDSLLRLGLVSRWLHAKVVAPPVSETMLEADWVSGASLMVRRAVLDQIGLLDERYFMYYEEVDFCWRARQAGWSCWYVPRSRVVHLVGQASGITSQVKRRADYWFESRRRFFVRNRGRLGSMLCDLAAISGLSLWQLRRLIERKSNPDPPYFLYDFCRHSVFVKGFSQGR